MNKITTIGELREALAQFDNNDIVVVEIHEGVAGIKVGVKDNTYQRMAKGGMIYKIQVKDSHDIQPKWEDDTWHTGGKKYLNFKDAQVAVKKLQGDTAYAHQEFKVVEDKEKMAEGGKVKFKDKVASIKASLLKRKKVPKAVQKI